MSISGVASVDAGFKMIANFPFINPIVLVFIHKVQLMLANVAVTRGYVWYVLEINIPVCAW
jgi:hypothetical protein